MLVRLYREHPQVIGECKDKARAAPTLVTMEGMTFSPFECSPEFRSCVAESFRDVGEYTENSTPDESVAGVLRGRSAVRGLSDTGTADQYQTGSLVLFYQGIARMAVSIPDSSLVLSQ